MERIGDINAAAMASRRLIRRGVFAIGHISYQTSGTVLDLSSGLSGNVLWLVEHGLDVPAAPPLGPQPPEQPAPYDKQQG